MIEIVGSNLAVSNQSTFLNCDMGESFGQWQMGRDEQIMPLIQAANIACGFHAGDPSVMRKTIALAVMHDVAIGAHTGYPDLNGFGRRSITMAKDELQDCIWYQLAALEGMSASLGGAVSYLKPHGAMYNDMMRNPKILECILQAVSGYNRVYPLMLQAVPIKENLLVLAQKYDVPLIWEGFCDRGYGADGLLIPRGNSGAVLTKEAAIAQGKQILQEGTVISDTGTTLPLGADTLCIHGDGEHALAIASALSFCVGKRGA